MAIVTKRTIMSLYSDKTNVYSHIVRIVLAEKGVNVEIIDVDQVNVSDDLLQINPYGLIPTLIDRELILYDAKIIIEYLDERFPHPPLLPVYPVARAESRKMVYRIEYDWYSLMFNIQNNNDADLFRKELLESFINLDPVFANKSYFLSEDFSLLDCFIAPLLWRLPELGIEIPETSQALHKYMQKVFNRDSFQRSLSENEKQANRVA